MSIFQQESVPCPRCGAENRAGVVASLNADRRPDLRQQVLDGTFQAVECTACGERFRLQPSFTYIDAGRRQWILAHPEDDLGQWPTLEAEARDIFAGAYGGDAPRAVRDLGAAMTARITFGWPALREKLVCADAGLSDAELELLKLAILRQIPNPPLADQSTLRLDRAEDKTLVFAWLDRDTEAVLRTLRVPRAALAEAAGDAVARTALAEMAGGMFVDLDRMLVAG